MTGTDLLTGMEVQGRGVVWEAGILSVTSTSVPAMVVIICPGGWFMRAHLGATIPWQGCGTDLALSHCRYRFILLTLQSS